MNQKASNWQGINELEIGIIGNTKVYLKPSDLMLLCTEEVKKRNEELTEALMAIENLLLFNEADMAEQIKKVCKEALGA